MHSCASPPNVTVGLHDPTRSSGRGNTSPHSERPAPYAAAIGPRSDVERIDGGGATFSGTVAFECAIPSRAIGAHAWQKSRDHLCRFLSRGIELGDLLTRIRGRGAQRQTLPSRSRRDSAQPFDATTVYAHAVPRFRSSDSCCHVATYDHAAGRTQNSRSTGGFPGNALRLQTAGPQLPVDPALRSGLSADQRFERPLVLQGSLAAADTATGVRPGVSHSPRSVGSAEPD